MASTKVIRPFEGIRFALVATNTFLPANKRKIAFTGT